MTAAAAIVAAAFLSALAAYLVARRQSSGRIANSEAADLWSESQAIREYLRDEVVSLRERVAVLEAEVARLKGLGS